MNLPLVSILTVNYNQSGVTCELLHSLRNITYPAVEIIVVDNASTQGDPTVIKLKFPEVTLIRNTGNSGFAGGNNLGLRHARGKYILFLNNDMEVTPGFVEPLVAKLESDPRIGAVSPKIKFYYQPDTIQYSGYSRINPYTVRSHGTGFRSVDRGQFDVDALTAFVHGAAMLVPVEVVRKVGLMAECYFLYYEELDWGNRIRKAGYELWYVHGSTVFHKESVTTGKMSALKVYYLNRSRLLYLRRNIRGARFLVAVLFQVFVSVPKNMLVFLIKGRKDYLHAYSKAIGWHLRNAFSKKIHDNPALKPLTTHLS